MITNPAYERDLAKLYGWTIITSVVVGLAFLVICLSSLYSAIMGMFRLNGGLIFLYGAIVQLIIEVVGGNIKERRLKLMLRHGLIDRAWKTDTEQKYNKMVLKLASAFNAKPMNVRIVDDAGSFSYVERRLSNSISIPLRASIELDDKQMEFLIAGTLIGFPQNLFDRYSNILTFLSCALLVTILPYCSMSMMILIGAFFMVLTTLLLISGVRSLMCLVTNSKSKYARILSVTKDYESAKTALMTESELAHRRMQMRTTETLINNYRNLGVCEEKAAISTLGITKEINKLRQAAEELGLEVEKGRTDDNQSGL